MHVSAESPSNIFPNPSEVIPEVPGKNRINWRGGPHFFLLKSSFLCYLGAHAKIQNSKTSLSRINLKLADFPVKIGLNGG